MKLLPRIHLVGSGNGGFDWTDPLDCNVYLLDGGNECALIDTGAGGSTEQILANIRADGIDPARISRIFLTHLHADHAGGASAIRKATGAAVIAHGDAGPALESGDETAIDLDRARAAGFYPAGYRMQPCPLDLPLRHGSSFTCGPLELRVLFAPGHSRFDIYLLVRTEEGNVACFTGDSLFPGGRISMISTRDFNLQSLAGSIAMLKDERVDSIFAGHLQPALSGGSAHIARACGYFDKLGVPPSIV